MSSVHPPVCLSVCLSLYNSCSVHRVKSSTVVFPAENFLFTSLDPFCCRIYRLATKHTEKKRIDDNQQVVAAGMLYKQSVISALPYRAAAASSRRFRSEAVPYVIHRAIGLLGVATLLFIKTIIFLII